MLYSVDIQIIALEGGRLFMTSSSPLEAYKLMQTYLLSGRFDKIGEVVDLEHYTENCVGITGWTTGFQTALNNWMSGFGAAFSDLQPTPADSLEMGDTGML